MPGDQPDLTPNPGPPEATAPAPLSVPPHAERIVLFGGTFDPPHRAHVEMGVRARDLGAGSGAWLVVVPAARSPFKDSTPTADPDRLEMLRRATADIPHASIWTDEIDRSRAGEPSYWVSTLERIKALRPAAALWFILGADQAAEFHRWRAPREVLRLASPIVLPRAPIVTAAQLAEALGVAEFWTPPEIEAWGGALLPLPPLGVSATEVRRLLLDAGPAAPGLGEMLTPSVLEYIRERGLYGRG